MSTASPSPTTAGPRWRDLAGGGRAPLLALILLGDWLVAADALVTTTLMPSVGASLSGFAWFGWTTSAFLTGTVVAGASAGWLSERIGLRNAMALSGLVLTIGCLMSAAAPDMGWFIAGRVFQGAAGGWVAGLTYVVMATAFPQAMLPRLFALANSVWGVATLLGPLIGGIFADAGWWRGVFWLFAAQAALFGLATLWLIPRRASGEEHGGVPVGALVLLTLAIASVSAAGVIEAVPVAAGLFAGGVALLAAAILRDLRSPHGLLPASVKGRGSPLRAAYAVYFATTAAGVAFSLYGPTLLRATLGLSGLAAGYVVAAEAVAWTTVAIAISGAGQQWQRRWLVGGPVLILAGVAMQAVVLGGGSMVAVILSGLLLGTGFGACYPFLGQRVMAMLSAAETTRGSAAIAGVRGAGGAVGAAVASLAANAAGFATGLSPATAPMVALAAFGASLPFALWSVAAAIRVVRARADQAAAGLTAAA
ncbi:MFS transporter [Sphingomonas canadensis]|uniref:MFS transporter n=1 Tax=Sphingomonas canadensis TaxID=1219257 RepID=A0ABW3H5P6_9SPHN|nr:MFS transporter [Sphingomonas canadensis]MCW3835868.1 MFS transporter [Sphingomonas canadensis]